MKKETKKLKKILAWIGIIVLLSLYLITFIVGVTGGPQTKNLLLACIALTVIVPVLLYAMMLLAKVLSGKNSDPSGEDPADRK